jgi:hypothetical protein
LSVDRHVDATEPRDRRGDGPLGALRVGDVQLGDEQVLPLADRRADGVRVAAGGDDVVTGGQGSTGELDAHPAPGAGDQPGPRLDGRHAMREAPIRALLGSLAATTEAERPTSAP